MARFRIRFRGPVSQQLVRWIERLVPLLREAPADVRVTVEIDGDEEEGNDMGWKH